MRPHQNVPSDTLSEISESSTAGTERSSCYSDYQDELQEFATSLGYSRSDELFMESFKVDRKRLEAMMLGKLECAESADQFFRGIMDETNTLIKWPTRLKIGAKSKKDPFVRIYGLEKNAISAKQVVISSLDCRSNRVTMKMDISYTDHSHIIGKGGQRIKRVMEDTSCHIHFPDSNRNNQDEKSNQVSIAGTIANIEKARARVRELTPLIFCFELPNVGAFENFSEMNSLLVSSIQETYNVQVMCRTQAKLHPTMVMVKGCEWEAERVKLATKYLIRHMCHESAHEATVQMMMEISPQYHSLVLGAQQQNLKTIMQLTGVRVMFPDPGDPYTPSLKKGSVTISGNIKNVFVARQMLMGSLPLILMFDYTSDSSTIENAQLESIMQTYDVYISARQKSKPNLYSIVIKGYERNATNIYEARRQLTGAVEEVSVMLPRLYQIPAPVPTFLKSFLSMPTNNSFNRASLQLPLPLGMCMKPFVQQRASTNGLSSAMSSLSFHNTMTTPRTPTTQSPHTTPVQQKYGGWPIADIVPTLGRFVQQKLPYYSPSVFSSHANVDTKDNCAFSPGLSSDTSSLSTSSRTVSPINSLNGSNGKLDLIEAPERRAPGFERSSAASKNLSEYQQMRIQAAQAMQGIPNNSKVRIPTQTWSGYGFSHSSPSALTPDRPNQEVTFPSSNAEENYYNTNSVVSESSENNCESSNGYGGGFVGGGGGGGTHRFAASNYLDAAASSTFNVVTSSNYSDLPSHLASLGLQKYTQLFKAQEIDLSTFITLTENDLKEIGVTAMGARRKMMLFISELKKREQMNVFNGNAAPGAEPKNSSCSFSPKNDNL